MRQPLIASSQTMHGSPLRPESFPSFCRSSTTPRRVQELGMVNPRRSSTSGGAFWGRSWAREMLVPRPLAAPRRENMKHPACIIVRIVGQRQKPAAPGGGPPGSSFGCWSGPLLRLADGEIDGSILVWNQRHLIHGDLVGLVPDRPAFTAQLMAVVGENH